LSVETIPAAAREANDPASLRRSLLKLAWPVVAEQLLTTAANMVDMIIVGRLGAVAIASIGLALQPLWLLMSLFIGLASGINALVARFFGARDAEGAVRGAGAAFWIGGVASAAVGVLLWFGAPAILYLMGAEPAVAPQGVLYLRALVPGLVAVYWSMLLSAALRAVGDTRSPFYIHALVNLLNVPATLMLVHGLLGAPALGVLGAGLATSGARLVGFALLLAVVVRRFGPPPGLPDLSLLGRMLRVGLPASLDRMSSTIAYLLFARIIAGLGTVAFAAHHVGVIAENVVWFGAYGLSTATAVMVGNSLGAREPDRAYGAVREAVRLTIWVIGPIGLFFILFARQYLMLFTGDPAVLDVATPALRIGGFGEVPMALVTVLLGAFQGAGDTRPLIWITLAGALVRIAATLLFVLVFEWGLAGAWFATLFDWGLRLALCWWRFRQGRWREVTV
jgi:putative MATE family efflux protein